MGKTERCWLRARRPGQKRERRGEILEAAAELFEEKGYDAVSLNGIARHVGLAKSALYRYFESKEQIFLTLLEEELLAWGRQATAALEAVERPSDPDTVGRLVAGSLAARPRMCALASIVSSVLERNISAERIADYKLRLMSELAPLIMALMEALPALSMDRAFKVLAMGYSLLSGLWPAANPPPAVAEVLARPEFEMMRVDFEEDLTTGMRWLLRGALSD